jgi:hypothetical protein
MQKQEGFGNPTSVGISQRIQKSPRPDVVELGLVAPGEGLKERLEKGFRQFI